MGKIVGLVFNKVVAPEGNVIAKNELLEKAKELGLDVKNNMSKAKLEELIKEAEATLNTPDDVDADDADAGDK